VDASLYDAAVLRRHGRAVARRGDRGDSAAERRAPRLKAPQVPFNREWDSDFGSRKSPARRVRGACRLDYASLCSSVGKQFGARGLSSRPPVGLAQNPLRYDQQQPRSMTCRSRPHRQQTPRLPRSKTSRPENASKSRLGARTGKRGNRRVVGEAPPHFILSQQRDAEIATNSENSLKVRTLTGVCHALGAKRTSRIWSGGPICIGRPDLQSPSSRADRSQPRAA
jgi:hypothetical protein